MDRAQTSQFGDRLRQLRERAGLTQEELAESAGLSPAAVGALERGYRRHPHPQTIRSLAEALGLAETDLHALREAAQRRVAAPPAGPVEAQVAPLPTTFTTLVGRARELDELTRLFATDTARLVTLTGPGGVGKTRLALETAAILAPRFSGAVAFISLAAVRDVGLVLPTIAEAIGVRDTGGLALAERLAHFLRDRPLLLVLDNLEHLPEAASPVADLLGSCRQLVVLATSRAPLRLRWELEYPVSPLGVPEPGRPSAIEDLAANDAVALFVERARAVVPEFALSATNAPAVAEVCSRLDGLPLAIELAAARVKVFQPEALLARLGSGLGLLTGGPRDQAARLQSMRAAIAWSYDLLEPEERAFFRLLSVFEDGFTLDAAEAVSGQGTGGRGQERDSSHESRETRDQKLFSGPWPLPSAFEGVASLVDKSLLRRLDSNGGEPRFGMFETIREYGLEQVTLAGDEAAARDAHAAHFLDLAEQAWTTFRRRAGQEPWLDRLEAERANLRVALTWLAECGDVASLNQLSGALYWFWYVRGPLSEGRYWLERALAAEAMEVPGMVGLRVLVGAGQLAHFQGDDDQAEVWLEKSLALSRDLEDPWWLGLILGILGAVAEDHGDYISAEAKFAGALDLFRAADDGANAGACLFHLGVVAWGQGYDTRAVELWEEAATLQRDIGDDWGHSHSLAYLGLLTIEHSEYARAAGLCRESLELRWSSRTWEDVAGSLADVAVLAAAVGQWERAARLFGAAEALREEAGRVLKLPERAVYEGAMARAREALGDAEYARADAAGRALPNEQAVAEAFALADEIARPEEGLVPTQR